MDRATVVVPTERYGKPEELFGNPFEVIPDIVLKHRDGELHRMNTSPESARETYIERRNEYDVTWGEQTAYSIGAALAVMTDLQAFGFRRERETAMSTDSEPITDFELVEIEPLDRGGIIVDSLDHLPVVLHRRDLTMWRVRIQEENIPEDLSGVVPDYAFAIEKRDGDDSFEDWEQLELLHHEATVAGAVATLGEHAGIEVLTDDVSSNAMEEKLDEHTYWWGDATDDEEEQHLRDFLGIQDRTVLFKDEVPDEYSFGR